MMTGRFPRTRRDAEEAMSTHHHAHGPRPTPCEIHEAEALAAPLRGEIARLGWTITGMTAEGSRPSWMHTVGLLVKYDHPELILVGFDEDASEILLALLAVQVAGGEVLTHETVVEVQGGRVELGWVHPRHFELDTFGMWEPLMQMHLFHFRPRALQVFVTERPEMPARRRWRLTVPQPIR
jgi:hypothetical protein